MRNSELFVLAAKLVLLNGFDYKNHPYIKTHEIDAIEQGIRELRFFDPEFDQKYNSMATRPVGKPVGAAQRK